MRNYNKSDIILYLTLLHPEHTAAYFRDIVNEIFDLTMKFAKSGGKMNITNFGSFRSKIIENRITRNPHTGGKAETGPRRRVHFRPSKQFKAINE